MSDSEQRDEAEIKQKLIELEKAYKADPSIENYVRLKRSNPDFEFGVAVIGGMEWFFANKENFEAIGIKPEIAVGILDADFDCITEVCLVLMELLIERKRLGDAGESHVSSRDPLKRDSFVNYLIKVMVDALEWNKECFIPGALVVLIRHQLGTEKTAWETTAKAHDKRQRAIWIAAELMAKGQEPSYRKIASIMGVKPSTVMRWFPDGDMTAKAEVIRESTERLGGWDFPNKRR